MESMNLHVVPVALRAASGVVAGHGVQLALPATAGPWSRVPTAGSAVPPRSFYLCDNVNQERPQVKQLHRVIGGYIDTFSWLIKTMRQSITYYFARPTEE
jgi:hypothetical protein